MTKPTGRPRGRPRKSPNDPHAADAPRSRASDAAHSPAAAAEPTPEDWAEIEAFAADAAAGDAAAAGGFGPDAPTPAAPRPRRAGAAGKSHHAGGTAGDQRTKLAGTLGMALGFACVLLLTALCWPDRETAEAAAPTPEEMDAIARPLSALLWRYVPARRYLRAAAGAEDWLLLGAALWDYGERAAPLVAASRKQHHPRRPRPARPARPASPQAAATMPPQQEADPYGPLGALFAQSPDGAGPLVYPAHLAAQ